MNIFYSTQIDDTVALLEAEEAAHCSRVLRKKVGDSLYVTDGLGGLYECEIRTIEKRTVHLTILRKQQQQASSNLAVAIAPTKNIARYEWFLEKATEIGIHTIIPVLTQRSERKVVKHERSEKILLAAMKQSKNLYLPKLLPLTPLTEVLKDEKWGAAKYIAHCMEPEKHLYHLYNAEAGGIVLIGPEGDFTAAEVATAEGNGWYAVSLGPSRLRTETAGIVACQVASMSWQIKI